MSRYYHGWHHIEHCLKMLQKHADLAEHYDEIAVALIFHDCVYDTHIPDECNVLRSAELFMRGLFPSVINDPEKTNRIYGCIMATTHKGDPTTKDEALTMDIDLSMLIAYEVEAIEFMIRKEYEWVPLQEYIRARKNILIGLYNREYIYHTETFRKLYEVETKTALLTMIQYNGVRAVVAGTFDLLHKGHRTLLKSAFKVAGNRKNSKVTIGLTSDEMASKKSHPVEHYPLRKRNISNFITRLNVETKWEIQELNDPLGDAATNPDYDILVASKETTRGALQINRGRVENGLSPMIIHLIEVITDEKGERISSTAIRRITKS